MSFLLSTLFLLLLKNPEIFIFTLQEHAYLFSVHKIKKIHGRCGEEGVIHDILSVGGQT
jgi:hypothetical protein